LGALADRTGIRVTDDEVRRRFQSIARQNNMEVAEYLDKLRESGGSVLELRKQIVSEMKILKLRQRDLESNIVVSDAEVKSFLKKQSQNEGTSDESLLAHILIQIPEGASQNEVEVARERAEDAVNRIDGGMDFRQVAAEMSDATDALDGGLLGWRDETTLPGLFLDSIKTMRVGGRSDVLQSPNGFHILFLFDKRGLNAQVIVQETLARHILIRVDELSSEKDALREITNIRNQILFDGADFSELAKSSSDDGSASNGGLLNWMMPGETVEPFDRAMNNLKIGEVSEPVRTQFGYHLIEVMERRDADVSEERREAVARQSIRQKKLEFRFQEWVQEVKDTTYIKYVN
jgi:peptidyl-prolyl cis-trans isomerase SurA